jgi:hypothetical protein
MTTDAPGIGLGALHGEQSNAARASAHSTTGIDPPLRGGWRRSRIFNDPHAFLEHFFEGLHGDEHDDDEGQDTTT